MVWASSLALALAGAASQALPAGAATNSSWTIHKGWNAIPKGSDTTEASLEACEEKATATEATIFAFNLHSKHCFLSKGTTFGGEKSDHETSGCLSEKVVGCGSGPPTPPPTPPTPQPPTPGGKCTTDLDCSLNGICSNATKTCECDSAWKGTKCATLNIIPGPRASGYRYIGDKVWGNTSSWGGGSWYDDKEQKW